MIIDNCDTFFVKFKFKLLFYFWKDCNKWLEVVCSCTKHCNIYFHNIFDTQMLLDSYTEFLLVAADLFTNVMCVDLPAAKILKFY